MKKFLTIEEATKKFPILTPALIKNHITPYRFHDNTGGYFIDDLCSLATHEALKKSEKSL